MPRHPIACSSRAGAPCPHSRRSGAPSSRTSRCRGRDWRRPSSGSARSPREEGVRIFVFGHAGDGNLHPIIVTERERTGCRRSRRERRRAADRIFALALELGGTITAEHGVGRLKREWARAGARRRRARPAAAAARAVRPAGHPESRQQPLRALPGTGSVLVRGNQGVFGELEREAAVREAAAGPDGGRDPRGLGQFGLGRAGADGLLGVPVDAVDALRRDPDGQRDELAVLERNLASLRRRTRRRRTRPTP